MVQKNQNNTTNLRMVSNSFLMKINYSTKPIFAPIGATGHLVIVKDSVISACMNERTPFSQKKKSVQLAETFLPPIALFYQGTFL